MKDRPPIDIDRFNKEIVPYQKFINEQCLRLCGNTFDADDLSQEVMIKAMRFMHLFEEGSNAKGWLQRIAKNTYINQYKKGQKESMNYIEDMSQYTDSDDDERLGIGFTSQEDSSMLSDTVVEAIESLRPEYKQIILLSDIYGFGYKDVSRFIGIPVGSCQSRLWRARHALAEVLEEYGKSKGLKYKRKKL